MKKGLISLFAVVLVFISVLAIWLYMFPDHVLKTISNVERGTAGLALSSVEVNGLDIKYLTGGEGETLILIHGFGANKDNWTRVSKYLTPHFRVVAPDLVGFGESARPEGAGYTITEQMERVKAFADKLNLKSFHLGGSSMGGNISAAFAATYPDYIKSLWLIAPGGVYSAEPSEMYGLLKKGENPLIAKDRAGYNGVLDFVFYKKPYIPGPVVDAFAAEAVRNKPINDIVFSAIHDKPLATDVVLTGCRIPALVVWGKNDRVLHFSGAEILGRNMKNAEVILMDETGHLPMIEKASLAAKDFLKFHNKG